MWADQESLVMWIAGFVLLVALVGVAIARLSHGRGTHRFRYGLAIACIVLVGAVSIASIESCGRCWLIFATTLPLMAVAATLDLRKSGISAAF